MATISVDPEHPSAESIERAAELIRHGRLVAFPTETVYGLGADALSADAVGRIYEAKGRPAFNPIIVHVLDAAQAREVVSDWPPEAERLAERFWPGPLTLVLPRRDLVPDVVTAGLETVAVRAPAHPVARALLAAAGRPIAAPSANRSNEVSPTSAAHVEASLGDRVELILDAGTTPVGIESTVLAIVDGVGRVLRPGMISRRALAECIPIEDAPPPAPGDSTTARPAPGMLDRHYAPRAQVVLSDDPIAIAAALRADGRAVGMVLAQREPAQVASPFADRTEWLGDDPAEYARRLYAALHHLDTLVDVIIVEGVPAGDEWEGVRDRLARAAAPDPDESAT